MKKTVFVLLLMFAAVCSRVQAYGATDTPQELQQLYAQSAVLMDGDTGRVLYEKDGYHFMPMASTTKVMTCILAVENASGEEIVQVSSYAASMPDVQLNIREGEEYYLKDLVYSLMLQSQGNRMLEYPFCHTQRIGCLGRGRRSWNNSGGFGKNHELCHPKRNVSAHYPD